ncbi:MAG: Spy/CpxP family protein refolding chaperone, partial [Proteobacteria bacterium]|nr:Spy/CpxP family protein refolding chaperone [Pseudomonadota bacterium]
MLAQEQGERRERNERRGQRMRGGQRGGMRQMQVGRVAERVAGALELSDEQRSLYDAIVKRHQEDTPSGEEMREIFGEMRAAREDGDQERVQGLAAQMREQREAATKRVNAFFDEVETILTDEQAEQLGGIRERVQQRGGRQDRGDRRGGDQRQTI